MTTEGMAKVTVGREIIRLNTDQGVAQCLGDIAAEKGCRPAAMISLQQQFAVAGALRESQQFTRPVARQSRLAPDIGIEPQIPFRFVERRGVAAPFADLGCAAEDVLSLRAL